MVTGPEDLIVGPAIGAAGEIGVAAARAIYQDAKVNRVFQSGSAKEIGKVGERI